MKRQIWISRGLPSDLESFVYRMEDLPDPSFLRVCFDGCLNEVMWWKFILPADYMSDPSVKVLFKMAAATTGEVAWKAYILSVKAGEAKVRSIEFCGRRAGIIAMEAPPGTDGALTEADVEVVNADGRAAGDPVYICLEREALSSAKDTAVGDAEVAELFLEYTAA